MRELNFIDSPRARVIEKGGRRIEVRIDRLKTCDAWSLRIVASNGSLTIWDDNFASDGDALSEALKTIEEDGIASFFLVSAPRVH